MEFVSNVDFVLNFSTRKHIKIDVESDISHAIKNIN